MTSALLRTGSGPIHQASLLTGSPKISLPLRQNSFSATDDKPEISPLRHPSPNRRISRATSEPQAITRLKSICVGSHMLHEAEEDSVSDNDDVIGCIASLKFAEKCFDNMSWTPESGIGGNGSGRDRGGYGSGRNNENDNDNEQNKIGAHYQKMLKSNPNDPILLRNYGKFLHEVEGDVVKAEECYGRAILASPGDGELLSLYGKLIWDTKRDGERAQSYFDQAVSVSPDDCMVMGSYAQFMWEAEEDDETNEDESGPKVSIPVLAVL